MCGLKISLLPICRQMADLEFKMEQALAQMSDTSIRYERSLIVARQDQRSLAIMDSFDRVRNCLPQSEAQTNDYDLAQLGAGTPRREGGDE